MYSQCMERKYGQSVIQFSALFLFFENLINNVLVKQQQTGFKEQTGEQINKSIFIFLPHLMKCHLLWQDTQADMLDSWHIKTSLIVSRQQPHTPSMFFVWSVVVIGCNDRVRFFWMKRNLTVKCWESYTIYILSVFYLLIKYKEKCLENLDVNKINFLLFFNKV